MPGDFEKSPPPKDIFVTIDPFPLRGSRDERPILTERIEAVCSEHPDYVVNSVIPIMSHGENSLTLFLLHLRRDDGDLSEDVSELRKKVDILVRMVSFLPDIRARIRDAKNGRYEMPDGWDDEIRDLFG
jgi:hypothetical protein